MIRIKKTEARKKQSAVRGKISDTIYLIVIVCRSTTSPKLQLIPLNFWVWLKYGFITDCIIARSTIIVIYRQWLLIGR
jgi:hypothetical protein